MRLVLAPLVLSLTFPALAAPSRPIALARAPGKDVNAAAKGIAAAWDGRTLGVGVSDARSGEDPSVVGAQQLKDKLLYQWKAEQPVEDGVRKMAEETLKSWGVAVSADSFTRLELAIKTVYVDEVPETFGSSYRAEVELMGRVAESDTAGSTSRVVRGTGKRSGPDKRAKLCNEALTLALEDALAQLLTAPAPATAAPTAAVVDATDANAVTPKAMLKELMRLKEAGVGDQILLNYVRQRKLASPLSVDDILHWKVSGLPESVIQAAQEAK